MKVDSELNVEFLVLRGVVTIRVKGRGGIVCAKYTAVMGIEKAEDGGVHQSLS